MTRPQNTIGDILRALKYSGQKSESQRNTVAAMLGFSTKPISNAPRQPFVQLQDIQVIHKPDKTRKKDDLETFTGSVPPYAPMLPTRVTPLRSPDPVLPEWIESSGVLPEAVDESIPEPPPIQPLLTPAWQSRILRAAVAVETPGALDIQMAIRRIANVEPIDNLPRKLRRSAAGRCELLIDVGETMVPFMDDARQFMRALGRLIPPLSLRVATFNSCPARGLLSLSGTAIEAIEPEQGAVVVLLTDLGPGIYRETAVPAVEEWARFGAGIIVQTGRRAVAFVPYASRRIAASLDRAFATVAWDRRTTAGAVDIVRRLGRR